MKLHRLEPGSAPTLPQTLGQFGFRDVAFVGEGEEGELQTLNPNSTFSELMRECSDPSLFVLGRGVAVMLSAVELSISNNMRDKELML